MGLAVARFGGTVALARRKLEQRHEGLPISERVEYVIGMDEKTDAPSISGGTCTKIR
jgi:hypothetical protein